MLGDADTTVAAANAEDEAHALAEQAIRFGRALRAAGVPTDAAAGMVLEHLCDALDECYTGLQSLEDALTQTRLFRPDMELQELDTALVDLGISHQTMEGSRRLLGHARFGLLRIERGEVS